MALSAPDGGSIVGLEIQGLEKSYGDEATGRDIVHVLNGLDLTVESGEFVSIVGTSGCGKTTLLKILAGLDADWTGTVLLNGHDISSESDKIGLIFQEYALLPWRTTLKNIALGLEIMGLPRARRRASAMEYVKTFGLDGFENRFPKELSGGMQQRVAIARTLITEPELILMDEPFGSLDSQTRNELQEFLLRLWQSRKDTIIFVTHNVDEAVFLSDRIVVLSDRPARVVKDFAVPCSRPRDRTSRECNEVRRAVLQTLKTDSI